MEKRVLISVFTLSALLFGLFCVLPLWSAFSDDTKIKDDEHLRHSFPMLDRNRKKRMAIEAAIGLVGIGISIIDLVASNIRQTFHSSGAEKSHQELISHFEQIHKELEQQQEELESINREIQKLGSSVIYFQHESKIRDGLLTLREYLHNPNEQNRNIFINKTADIDHSIRVLIDGLLGQSNFGPDIMAIIRVATECRGRKLRNSVKSVESLVMTGLYVRREYQRIAINATDFLKESPFKKYIDTSVIKLEKRLNDKVVECYADEKNVGAEMGRILKVSLTESRKIAANSLLEFLEEKYDNKKWIVIQKGSRALRNKLSRLFLSVEAGYGRVKPWINRPPTQLWNFDDGLLRNDDGKCLAGKGWFVQEVACDADRMGNNGLWTYTENHQIKSKNGYCLSNGSDEGSVYYDYCKDEPGQHWR